MNLPCIHYGRNGWYRAQQGGGGGAGVARTAKLLVEAARQYQAQAAARVAALEDDLEVGDWLGSGRRGHAQRWALAVHDTWITGVGRAC